MKRFQFSRNKPQPEQNAHFSCYVCGVDVSGYGGRSASLAGEHRQRIVLCKSCPAPKIENDNQRETRLEAERIKHFEKELLRR